MVFCADTWANRYAVIKIAAGYRHSLCCVRRLSAADSELLAQGKFNLTDPALKEVRWAIMLVVVVVAGITVVVVVWCWCCCCCWCCSCPPIFAVIVAVVVVVFVLFLLSFSLLVVF